MLIRAGFRANREAAAALSKGSVRNSGQERDRGMGDGTGTFQDFPATYLP
jgi:hypothetical protein